MCDFAGIAECEQAGYGLGRVVVLESWKGVAAASRFTLGVESDPIHGRRGLLLAGRKYLLLANSMQPAGGFGPRSLLWGHEPTTLSRRRAEFGAGIVSRWIELPAERPLEGSLALFGSLHENAAALRADIIRFQSLTPEKQEMEALRAVFLARLPRGDAQPGGPLAPAATLLAEEVRRAASVRELLQIMLRPGVGENAALYAIDAGGEITLSMLLRGPPPESRLDPHVVRFVVGLICSRQPELATNLTLRPKLRPAEELQRMQATLATMRAGNVAASGEPGLRALGEELRLARTPEGMVRTLSARGADIPLANQEAWAEIIVAGGAESLRALEACDPEGFGLGGGLWEWCRSVLRLQLGLPAAPRKFTGCDDRAPAAEWWLGQASDGQLARWRDYLAGKDDGKGMASGHWPSEAFSRLTVHDPAYAADWLLKFEAGARTPQGWPTPEAFAGYFADVCQSNRTELLRRLLAAPNLSVRAVCAAVLADDDPAAALPVLDALRNAPDGAGDLANLQFARRGDKAAMDRLVELLRPLVYASTNRPPPRPRFVWPVVEEVKALLSNSAKASSLSHPDEDYAGWWGLHRNRVKPADPWLEDRP